MDRNDSDDSQRVARATTADVHSTGETDADGGPVRHRTSGRALMPCDLVVDRTIPIVAARFPLAAAVLSAYAHKGTSIGAYAVIDAARIDASRIRLAIPSAVQSSHPARRDPVFPHLPDHLTFDVVRDRLRLALVTAQSASRICVADKGHRFSVRLLVERDGAWWIATGSVDCTHHASLCAASEVSSNATDDELARVAVDLVTQVADQAAEDSQSADAYTAW